MTNRWRAGIPGQRPLVIDGGTGSELARRGVPVDPAAWHAAAALTHYATLVEVHTDFIRTGADAITTNTFATHRYVLDAAGLGAEHDAINAASVAAAREARDALAAPVVIAGSLSCLPPRFDPRNYPDETTERASYRELAEALAGLGVDVLALEMVQDPRRGAWLLEAAKATGLPVWLGVSCRRDIASRLVGFDLTDIALVDVLDALIDLEPDAVNVMHTPCDSIADALSAVRDRWGGTLGAYPEVGSYDTRTRQRTNTISPAALATRAEVWLDAGAQIIGGCCGARPKHIAALRGMLAARVS